LVVNKAQTEPHFSSMYAQLCLKFVAHPTDQEAANNTRPKRCKKLLLDRRQDEFEEDTQSKIRRATQHTTDPEEIKYHANIAKKEYLGHIRFIGELYKQSNLIRINIMIFCLVDLLGLKNENDKGDNDSNDKQSPVIDEEKIECFSKLMTTVGHDLQDHAQQYKTTKKKSEHVETLASIWKHIYFIIIIGRNHSYIQPTQIHVARFDRYERQRMGNSTQGRNGQDH